MAVGGRGCEVVEVAVQLLLNALHIPPLAVGAVEEVEEDKEDDVIPPDVILMLARMRLRAPTSMARMQIWLAIPAAQLCSRPRIIDTQSSSERFVLAGLQSTHAVCMKLKDVPPWFSL